MTEDKNTDTLLAIRCQLGQADAWMATVASVVFLIVSVTTSLVRSDPSVALNCGAIGVAFVILSFLLLKQSYHRRSELQRLADQLRQ